MTTVKPRVDVVIVGMGWTGAIMAKQLTDAGLAVVALERGADRDTQPDFARAKPQPLMSESRHAPRSGTEGPATTARAACLRVGWDPDGYRTAPDR